MNFTLDDTDPALAFSPGGWAVQSPTDPYLDQFFDETYHAALQDGATMTYMFIGSAFGIYGSKGPGHARLEVQFDNTVVQVDASAPQTAFRQELFAHAFGSAEESAQHLVKLTAVLSGTGCRASGSMWTTSPSLLLSMQQAVLNSKSLRPVRDSSTAPVAIITSSPPWITGSSSTSASTSSTPTAASPSTSPSSSSSHVPTILAALFGAVVGIALLLLAAYFILRRIYDRRRARERAFRYGQSSANPSVTGAATAPYAQSSGASAKSAAVIDVAGMSALDMRHTPSLPGHGAARDGSMSNNPVEKRSMSMDVQREAAGTPTTSVSRALLSASPIAWTRQKVGKGHKGDADSLRTDFLQV
ncbi:hypothetical protein BD414DRAFT_510025 [Trametes punicea]|nr:hypothetical protein BD414DRAFT_510025 [Trametes punicea]